MKNDDMPQCDGEGYKLFKIRRFARPLFVLQVACGVVVALALLLVARYGNAVPEVATVALYYALVAVVAAAVTCVYELVYLLPVVAAWLSRTKETGHYNSAFNARLKGEISRYGYCHVLLRAHGVKVAVFVAALVLLLLASTWHLLRNFNELNNAWLNA